MPDVLTVAILIESPVLLQSLQAALAGGRYSVWAFAGESDFLNFLEKEKNEIDCLILQVHRQTLQVVNRLYQHGTVLPAIFLHSVTADSFICTDGEQPGTPSSKEDWPDSFYHASEIFVSDTDLTNIGSDIDRALAKFLNLTPQLPPDKSNEDLLGHPECKPAFFLLQQQRRLSEKLKERLGYLAVYYNRNSSHFFRHLSAAERQSLSAQLKEQYRQILLMYFHPESSLNDLLDQFVTAVFFADLSVSEVVEIHMDLMDDFSKQLKLEGWSEDILLDYRLTLIDVIAHLCEMYRRSIPRQEQ